MGAMTCELYCCLHYIRVTYVICHSCVPQMSMAIYHHAMQVHVNASLVYLLNILNHCSIIMLSVLSSESCMFFLLFTLRSLL